MEKLFKGKNILITGGAGSFGSILTSYILNGDPQRVRVFDHNEEAVFRLEERLKKYTNLRCFLGDIRSQDRLKRAMEDVDIVIHCAALKHVYSCEYNPFEATKTNVIGTQNLIEVAIDEEVERVMFTSSDKAANPTNVMGTTKLLAEKLIVAANYYKGERETIFSCVRFGNVMGSSGSVVPLFKRQISEGGPITLTDPAMTRFLISMQQAIRLVFESIDKAHGGEVFIMKMPSLRICDLAEVMRNELAPRYGFKPEDITSKEIGIKAGEKLYEDLMSEEEITRSLETDEFYIVLPQLREVYEIDRSNYAHARKPKIERLTSNDVEFLTKKGIRDLLLEENLL